MEFEFDETEVKDGASLDNKEKKENKVEKTQTKISQFKAKSSVFKLKSIMSKKFNYGPLAGVGRRFLSLFIDIISIVVLKKYLITLKLFEPFLDKISEIEKIINWNLYSEQILGKMIWFNFTYLKLAFLKRNTVEEIFYDLPIYFIMLAAWLILGNLLFGVSISQKLVGVEVRGNIFFIRVLGVIRSILSLLLLPLLIFDLPILFGKRTFKEVITMTRLQNGRGIADIFDTPDTIAGFFNRVFALFGDLIICYLLYIIVNSQEFLLDLKNQLWVLFEGWYPLILKSEVYLAITSFSLIIDFKSFNLEDIKPVFFIIVTSMSYFLITNLILGVSICQLILGIEGKGSFLIKRIGAVLRTVIGFITWPFLLFDLPILFKKRSLKEIISFSPLLASDNARKFIGVVFLLPLIILTIISAPMFENLELVKSIKIKHRSISEVKSMIEGQLIMSGDIPFQTRSKFNKFVVSFPYFISRENSQESHTRLSFYDLKEKDQIEFVIGEARDLNKILSQVLSNDFLFRFKYKILYKTLEELKGNTISLSKAQKEKLKEDLFLVQKRALELDLTSFITHLFKYGPFISGYLKLKKYIIKQLDLKKNEITFYTIGDGRFLGVDNLETRKSNKWVSRKFFSMEYFQFSSFKIETQNIDLGNEKLDEWSRLFFNKTKWKFDTKRDWLRTINDTYEIRSWDPFFAAERFTDTWDLPVARKTFDEMLFNHIDTVSSHLVGLDGREHHKFNLKLVKILHSYLESYPDVYKNQPTKFSFAKKIKSKIKFLNKGRVD